MRKSGAPSLSAVSSITFADTSRWRPTTTGAPVLMIAGLLAGDLLQGVAEEAGMVDADGRDRADRRLVDDVGGVEAPAEPDLQHQQLGRNGGEDVERRRRDDLEEGDRIIAVGRLAGLDRGFERVVVDNRAGQPDALVEAHEMRRGVDVHAVARRLGHGADVGAERALAVGAGDMHDRRQALLGIAHAVEQALEPREVEIDDARMARHQSFDECVRRHARTL